MKIKRSHRSQSGQLLLPMMAVLILFSLFFIVHVKWCLKTYWQLRMDAVADLTALSAAREQARMLNYIATCQVFENVELQKVGWKGIDLGVMEIPLYAVFKVHNTMLQTMHLAFIPNTYVVASRISYLNGATRWPIPLSSMSSGLKAHKVRVMILYGLILVGYEEFDTAYFTRGWKEKILHAQPDHVSRWRVTHNGTSSVGSARLWLDVDPKTPLFNGGFPSEKLSFIHNIGIQCFPQFSARLDPKR